MQSGENTIFGKLTDYAQEVMCSAPVGWGHYALMTVVCLSVCLSIPCLNVSLECMEGHRKLKIGRKEAHDTGDP